MNTVKEEHYQKAERILKDKEEQKRKLMTCLKAMVCPECGELLTRRTKYYGEESEVSDTIYKCTRCAFGCISEEG